LHLFIVTTTRPSSANDDAPPDYWHTVELQPPSYDEVFRQTQRPKPCEPTQTVAILHEEHELSRVRSPRPVIECPSSQDAVTESEVHHTGTVCQSVNEVTINESVTEDSPVHHTVNGVDNAAFEDDNLTSSMGGNFNSSENSPANAEITPETVAVITATN